MSSSIAPPDRGQTGLKFESLPNPATPTAGHQAEITGGIHATRAKWIYNGLADIEHSAISVLLRAPAGGEARAILEMMPPKLTLRPLDEIVEKIRRGFILRRWDEMPEELVGDHLDYLRAYSQGPKCRFTDAERRAHDALVELLRREGGKPWK